MWYAPQCSRSAFYTQISWFKFNFETKTLKLDFFLHILNDQEISLEHFLKEIALPPKEYLSLKRLFRKKKTNNLIKRKNVWHHLIILQTLSVYTLMLSKNLRKKFTPFNQKHSMPKFRVGEFFGFDEWISLEVFTRVYFCTSFVHTSTFLDFSAPLFSPPSKSSVENWS